MFKNNEHTEKQRFSIKKYSFGVTSALVGVFLAAGANSTQANEVNPAPTATPTPTATTQAAPAPAVTTQAAKPAPAPAAVVKPVPVIEKTTSVESVNVDNNKMSISASELATGKSATISKVEVAPTNKKVVLPDEVKVKQDGQNYPVTEIRYEALKGATNVEEVVLPNKLKSLGERALKDTKIQKIELPKSLQNIGTAALGTKTLEEVSLYQYNQTSSPFLGAENLRKINFLGEWKGALGQDLTSGSGIEEIVIPEGVTNLAGALDETPNLKDIYLPSTFKGENDFDYSSIDQIAIDKKKEGLTLWVYENSEGHKILEKTRADIISKNAKFNNTVPVFEIKFRGAVPVVPTQVEPKPASTPAPAATTQAAPAQQNTIKKTVLTDGVFTWETKNGEYKYTEKELLDRGLVLDKVEELNGELRYLTTNAILTAWQDETGKDLKPSVKGRNKQEAGTIEGYEFVSTIGPHPDSGAFVHNFKKAATISAPQSATAPSSTRQTEPSNSDLMINPTGTVDSTSLTTENIAVATVTISKELIPFTGSYKLKNGQGTLTFTPDGKISFSKGTFETTLSAFQESGRYTLQTKDFGAGNRPAYEFYLESGTPNVILVSNANGAEEYVQEKVLEILTPAQSGVQDLRPFIKEDLAALAKIKAAQAGKTTAKVSNKATQSKSAAKSTRKAGANVLPKTSATETNSALPAGLAAALVAAGLMTAKRRKN